MTTNESLNLSSQIKDLLKSDLLNAFYDDVPINVIEHKVSEAVTKSRDRIFTPSNVILTMLLSATQEDKSLQNGLNIFKSVFESRCKEIIQVESQQLREEQINDLKQVKKPGRPKKYLSRLPKSYHNSLSNSTAAYSTARKKLDINLFQNIFKHSKEFGSLDKELWHGMKTYLCDGTYLQLQDTTDIKSQYVVKGLEESYPQALLQVMIRQGSGQISQFAVGSRQQSELSLVIDMIKNLEKNSLLMADDLYNTYYHFNLILEQGCHIIVPGKRDRTYTVIRDITSNDQIVEIHKTSRPDYISKDEWKNIPDKIMMRRITYNYPTKNGLMPAVLFTTILDEKIIAADIIIKYGMRWDIEISIREIKTIMDINVLRSKSRDMLSKELIIALTAYNLIRKIIARTADKVGFSPQKDIFQKYGPFDRTILLDKRGRVFFKWSQGRYGKVNGSNKQTHNTTSKR